MNTPEARPATARRRRWRRPLAALAILAALLVAGDLAARSIRFDRRDVERRATDLLGRPVSIGEFHLELLPSPRFEAHSIAVANPPGRGAPQLIEIGVLDLEFRLLDLLFGRLEIDSVRAVDADLYLMSDSRGQLDVPHEALASAGLRFGAWRIVVRELDLLDFRIHYQASRGAPVRGVVFEALQLSTPERDTPIALRARGNADGGSFDLAGQLGSLRELEERTAPYPFDIRGALLDATGSARGTLDDPLALRGISARISARLDLNALDLTTGLPVSSLGPLDISGLFTDAHGSIGVQDLRVITVYEDALRLQVTGSVRDVVAIRGVDLALRIDADDPEFLEPFLGQRFSGAASLDTDATLSDADGSLGVQGELRADWEDRIRLEVAGRYDDLAERDEIDVRSRLFARDVATLAELLRLPMDLPPIGPVDVSARLSDRDGELGVAELSAEVGARDGLWALARGSIRDLLALEGVQLEVAFGAPRLSDVASYAPFDLPDLSPIEGTAELSDGDGDLGVDRFVLRAGREELLDLEVTGAFDDLRGMEEIDVDVRLAAQNLSVVTGAFGVGLPPLGPVELAGSLTGSKARLRWQGAARINRTRFDGEWRASFAAGARPRIWGRVHSPHVYMEDLHIRPESAWDESDLSEALKPQPLPWYEHLRQVDLDVVVRADASSGRPGPGPRFQAVVQLEDGDLAVDYRSEGEGAEIQARLRADARTADPNLALQLNVDRLDTKRIFEQLTGSAEQTGLLDVRADLTTRGRTPSEMRARLDGSVRAMLRDGTLASDYARLFTFDIIAVSFPDFRSPSRAPRVACGLIDLSLGRGRADVDRFVLQGYRSRVTGEGSFDVERGELDLTLVPECFDPALVRTAATVQLTGPIQAPTIRPSRRSMATSLLGGVVSNLGRIASPVLRPTGPREAPAADECADSLAPLHIPPPTL
jgi:hypothetical protein